MRKKIIWILLKLIDMLLFSAVAGLVIIGLMFLRNMILGV